MVTVITVSSCKLSATTTSSSNLRSGACRGRIFLKAWLKWKLNEKYPQVEKKPVITDGYKTLSGTFLRSLLKNALVIVIPFKIKYCNSMGAWYYGVGGNSIKVKMRRYQQYQQSIDILEGLVVAHMFELTKMNMSQTGESNTLAYNLH